MSKHAMNTVMNQEKVRQWSSDKKAKFTRDCITEQIARCLRERDILTRVSGEKMTEHEKQRFAELIMWNVIEVVSTSLRKTEDSQDVQRSVVAKDKQFNFRDALNQ